MRARNWPRRRPKRPRRPGRPNGPYSGADTSDRESSSHRAQNRIHQQSLGTMGWSSVATRSRACHGDRRRFWLSSVIVVLVVAVGGYLVGRGDRSRVADAAKTRNSAGNGIQMTEPPERNLYRARRALPAGTWVRVRPPSRASAQRIEGNPVQRPPAWGDIDRDRGWRRRGRGDRCAAARRARGSRREADAGSDPRRVRRSGGGHRRGLQRHARKSSKAAVARA